MPDNYFITVNLFSLGLDLFHIQLNCICEGQLHVYVHKIGQLIQK